MVSYVKGLNIKGCTITELEDPDRSPFIIVNVDETDAKYKDNCVLLYGHLDKQPLGDRADWNTDPLDPVIKDGKMYGRGSSDDGYSLFSAALAIKAVQEAGKHHPRIVITIEGSEEGEIDDLLYYMEKYKSKLGNPNLVICLDSEATLDSTLTLTTTLRGVLDFSLKVTLYENGVHSGLGGGIGPSPFPIASKLLERLMDFKT